MLDILAKIFDEGGRLTDVAYAGGLISGNDLGILEQALHIRNLLIHGNTFSPLSIDPIVTESLLEIIRKLQSDESKRGGFMQRVS